MMQYHWQINETGKKKKTTRKYLKYETQNQVTAVWKPFTSWPEVWNPLNVHFIYSNSEFPHQVSGLTTYTICRRGEKVWQIFLSLSLSGGLGSLTSALPVFSSSPGFEGFSSHQGARAATSLLSQPLLPHQHAHTHAGFPFQLQREISCSTTPRLA